MCEGKIALHIEEYLHTVLGLLERDPVIDTLSEESPHFINHRYRIIDLLVVSRRVCPNVDEVFCAFVFGEYLDDFSGLFYLFLGADVLHKPAHAAKNIYGWIMVLIGQFS